jgi:acyl-CoA synthetase (AMP-forming)/AMP-acid ligase II
MDRLGFAHDRRSMVNELTKSEPPTEEAQEPFPQSGLAALIAAAARDSPGTVLLRDDDLSLTAAELAARVENARAHLHDCGLAAGERALVVAGTHISAVVALAAVLSLGAEPALVPCGVGAADLVTLARLASAVALIGPSRFGGLECGDAYLSAAALVDTVRTVATLGPEPVDGAIDLSRAAHGATGDAGISAGPAETAVIATFQWGAGTIPALVSHRQAALFADALSLVENARINPSKRIISTLPPATMAGLVAGPFAALIGASSLTLHGPFDAARFLAACDAEPGAHLVAPASLARSFADPSVASGLSSLILVSRFLDPHAFVLPSPVASARPIVDLYAFGEETLLARRRTDGEARPPVRITDKSPAGGLGARLNRARAEIP